LLYSNYSSAHGARCTFPSFLANSFRFSLAPQDRNANLFLCFFHRLDGFYRLDSSQHSEIDGISQPIGKIAPDF
jgi:hypothetical protein